MPLKQYDVTLLTAASYLHPEEPNWYVQQILLEDRLVIEALERKGLRVHCIDWTNKEFDWTRSQAVLLRAVWDYTERYEEFLNFLKIVSTKTNLINPLQTVLWNLDKHYLRDLFNRGINIPQTVYIEKNETTSLRQLHEQYRLTETILKPAMSAGARHTYRLNPRTLDQHENIFQQLIANEAMMLQPFLHSVITLGEVTLIMIGGKYSHAVMKKVKPGDFRVQDDFGGSVQHYTPSPDEIAFAEKAVSSCDPLPAYGRVDILRDNNDMLVVSEMELIEPELWFRFHPPAADKFAVEIIKMI